MWSRGKSLARALRSVSRARVAMVSSRDALWSSAVAPRAREAARAREISTSASRSTSRRPPPPASASASAVWEPVVDERTGKTYWWNVETDETTDVDAPRPKTYSVIDPTMPAPIRSAGAPPPDRYDDRAGGGSVVGGLGSMMAQGAAWGMGSSLGHRVMGGMFGGYGSSPSSDVSGSGSTPQPFGGGSGAGEFDDDDGDGYGDGGGSLFDFFSEDE